jgi:hypothetical protein
MLGPKSVEMFNLARRSCGTNSFQLLQVHFFQSFDSGSVRLKEKLLTFLGTIGRDNRLGRTAETMLDVVWGLARRPDLPAHLVDRAMKQHLNILSHSATRDSVSVRSFRLTQQFGFRRISGDKPIYGTAYQNSIPLRQPGLSTALTPDDFLA